MKKAVCVLGATAVGKTSVALEIAKNLNGAILSADSVQLFKNLNIISGKDIDPNSKFVPLENNSSDFNLGCYLIDNVPIYMLDIIEPDRKFSVSEFKKAFDICLDEVFEHKKLPIVVGGSGLYINSILNPMNTLNVKPDYKLRNELENKSLDEIEDEIKILDNDYFENLNDSEKKNKRRLIRKIEILKSANLENDKDPEVDYLILGLNLPKEENEKLAKKRVSYRIENGALSEARSLFKIYDSLSEQVKSSIGYKDLFSYLKGEISFEKAIENWEKSENKLIKKQKTWFKRDSRIKWFNSDRDDLLMALSKEIKSFLHS